MDNVNIVHQEIHIKAQKIGQKSGGAHADDVYCPRRQDHVNDPIETFAVDFLHGGAKFFDIGRENRAENICLFDFPLGNFNALHCREPTAERFLHRPAHRWIAVIPEFGSKAHNG